jgi:hypothetical protein
MVAKISRWVSKISKWLGLDFEFFDFRNLKWVLEVVGEISKWVSRTSRLTWLVQI